MVIADQQGRRLRPDRFANRIVAVTMLPRICDTICTLRIVDLDRSARLLPPEAARHVAFVAIDTAGRSGRALRRLATTLRLDRSRWTLLRGDTQTAWRRIDVIPPDADAPSHVVALFDAAGHLRQRYTGAPLDRERFARETAAIAALAKTAPAPAGSCTVQ